MAVPDIDLVKQAATAATQSHDQYTEVIKWIGVTIAGFAVMAKPILNTIRKFNEEKVAKSQDDAAVTLYEQLQKQIQDNAQDIRKISEERNDYFQKYIELNARLSQLEEYEKTIISMKERLDAKDRLLEQRSEENNTLMREIVSLTNRIHDLEMNLNIARGEIASLKH